VFLTKTAKCQLDEARCRTDLFNSGCLYYARLLGISTSLVLGLPLTSSLKEGEDVNMSYVRPNIPHDEPNAETQKAMRDGDERKNLTRCNTVKEFWKVVGIDPNT